MSIRSRLFASLVLLAPTTSAACGDGAAVSGADTRVEEIAPDTTSPDTSEPADDTADGPDTIEGDDDSAEPDTSVADDTAEADTTPTEIVNPQADAWTSAWNRTLTGAGARVLGLRYIGGGQNTTGSLIALVEIEGGASALVDDDAAEEALPGEGRRLVALSLDPASGRITGSGALELPADEALGAVTKAPNGFAVALGASPSSRVALAQIFGAVIRVTTLTFEADAGTGDVTLPPAGDLALVTSGGAATALALQLTAPGGGALALATAATTVRLPVGEGGIAFVTLAAPAEDVDLPEAGTMLAVVPELVADRVVETQSGPVLVASVTSETTVDDEALVPGQSVLLIGALPEATADEGDDDKGVIPIVLWSSTDAGAVEVVQVASAGVGGLVLAGVGQGEVRFGEDTRELTEAPFVATLGSDGGFVYTAASCDRILGISAGFSFRILRSTCDLDGQGPALVMTQLAADELDGSLATFDNLLVPLASQAEATLLSGLVSFSVDDGRAYGGLFDLGAGPRLLVSREDGQFYDSGVLPQLARSGASEDPLFFLTLRQGGGGGGGGGNNPNTNGVVFAVPREGGPLIGRARIDLKTYIW